MPFGTTLQLNKHGGCIREAQKSGRDPLHAGSIPVSHPLSGNVGGPTRWP